MFSRLSFLRVTAARSAARALRVRDAEHELRKVAERVSEVGGLVEAEKSALRMLEVCADGTVARGISYYSRERVCLMLCFRFKARIGLGLTCGSA